MSNGNDYIVQEILGQGSFSKVFKLLHKPSGVMFAGKYLKKLFRGKLDVVNCAEINVMKRIEDHPNILRLKNLICDSFPCHLILVFELMDMNLFEFLKDKQKPLSESAAKSLFHQIICGIQHLHRNCLFHRDVKPENILVKFNNVLSNSQNYKNAILKLADFGSAEGSEMDVHLTTYVATRWYRAPECILTDGYYGPKIDIWSAGCIFYEMLTLSPLFPGESNLDQLDKIHKILGTPNSRVLRRIRHLKTDLEFPKVECISFNFLLPNLSTLGLNVLRTCLSYLPGTRIDSTSLKDHYYFRDERPKYSARRRDGNLKSSLSVSVSTRPGIHKSS